MKPTFARIGVVSEGTLRDEDLISAFAGELDYYLDRLRLSRDQRARFAKLVREANTWDGAEHSDPPHDEIGTEIVSELQNALDEIAPPYCYFGTAEGDGACFGFWPAIDNHDGDCAPPRLAAGDEIDREHWGEDVLLVNDHGNVSCGHVDKRGRFKAYWDCV